MNKLALNHIKASFKFFGLFFIITLLSYAATAQNKNINTAFNDVKNTKNVKALKNFYLFWEQTKEDLLASSTSKSVIDHDKNPATKVSDYNGLLYLGKLFKSLSNLKHTFAIVREMEVFLFVGMHLHNTQENFWEFLLPIKQFIYQDMTILN